MFYEYKLVPIDRKTGEPAFDPEDVKPQVVVDIMELNRVMDVVNPPWKAGPLPALMMTPDKDRQIMTGAVARALSEMYGADVYFRQKQPRSIHVQSPPEEPWQKQPSLWRPKHKRS